MATVVLSAAGLPLEAIGYLYAIDRVLDMMRTMTNVTGQMLVPVLVVRETGLLDREVYEAASSNIGLAEGESAEPHPVGAAAGAPGVRAAPPGDFPSRDFRRICRARGRVSVAGNFQGDSSMRMRHFALLLAGLAAVAPAFAADADRWTLPVAVRQLDNGLTVVVSEDHSSPTVGVSVVYHVGMRLEPRNRTGFAHLFEHLMFEGTPNAPEGTFDRVITGGGGRNNGSTRADFTNYI